MPSRYWLVSLPVQVSKDNTWRGLEEKMRKVSYETVCSRLHIPDLRVGTLDSLLALSDELVKTSAYVEGVASKIQRQVEDFDRTIGRGSSTLAVDGLPIESFMSRFTWDEAKYPVMTPLRETVDTIHEGVSKLEDELKVRVSEYNTVKGQLNAINRKAGGSLLARELATLVQSEDLVVSEHLVTLLVVVSKFAEKDWLTTYETLSNFVVPRSSKKLTEDGEYALFTVTLFKRVADSFKSAAREKGFQVRDYDHDPEGHVQRKEEVQQLTADMESMRGSLREWCLASYGEVFSSWIHVCAVRLFAESILRHGLPPTYVAAVLSPPPKLEKRARDALEQLCLSQDSNFWKLSDADASMAGLAGGESESFPYVSLTVNLLAQ